MDKTVNGRPLSFIKAIVRQYFEDGVPRSAAELAYYLLFSVFPTLIVLNTAIGRLNLRAEELLQSLNIVLPAEIVGIFSDYLAYIQGQGSHLMFYSSLFIAVYMGARAMRSLMRSVTRAYRMERRGIVYLAVSFGLSLILLLSLLILLAILVLGGVLLETLGRMDWFSPEFISLLGWLGYILAPAYLFLLVALFYDLAGGRRYSFRMAMPGAGFFVVIWMAGTYLFSYYVSNMSNYSLLYGSIGAVMILMLWLYLTAVLLILGGVVNRAFAEEILKHK